MYILQQNKAIPPMFSGVPATLIYTGLLALAFTGFAGGSPLF
jgi:Na+-translocating ferredoxin:NAD+ oxidoreductase RnfA subunit